MRLQLLRHPNVVSFFGIVLEGFKGRLVLEYCEGASCRGPAMLPPGLPLGQHAEVQRAPA